MSEVTYELGEIPICPYCEIKHVSDAVVHSEGGRKKTLEKIQKDLAKMAGINIREYAKVREVEHQLEDYKTVLRDMRHKLEAPKMNPNPVQYKPYAWTKCEKAHPAIQRKIQSCAKKIEQKQKCPPRLWGTSPQCVNPYAVCRASIKCP